MPERRIRRTASGRTRQRRARNILQRRDRVTNGQPAMVRPVQRTLALPERGNISIAESSIVSAPEAESTDSHIPTTATSTTLTGVVANEDPPGENESAEEELASGVHGYNGDDGNGTCLLS